MAITIQKKTGSAIPDYVKALIDTQRGLLSPDQLKSYIAGLAKMAKTPEELQALKEEIAKC